MIISIPKTTCQSIKRIESYSSLPIPGMLKMTSRTTDPAIAAGKLLTRRVITGSMAFGRMCFVRILKVPIPFAFAVMK